MAFTYNRTGLVNSRNYEETEFAKDLSGIKNQITDNKFEKFNIINGDMKSGAGINNGVLFEIGALGEVYDVSGYTGYIVVKSTLNGLNSTSEIIKSATYNMVSTPTIKYYVIYKLNNGVIDEDYRGFSDINDRLETRGFNNGGNPMTGNLRFAGANNFKIEMDLEDSFYDETILNNFSDPLSGDLVIFGQNNAGTDEADNYVTFRRFTNGNIIATLEKYNSYGNKKAGRINHFNNFILEGDLFDDINHNTLNSDFKNSLDNYYVQSRKGYDVETLYSGELSVGDSLTLPSNWNDFASYRANFTFDNDTYIGVATWINRAGGSGEESGTLSFTIAESNLKIYLGDWRIQVADGELTVKHCTGTVLEQGAEISPQTNNAVMTFIGQGKLISLEGLY